MRVRYLLLVLLGMALGCWAKGGWVYGNAVDKAVHALHHDLVMLTVDKRFDLRPETATDREARRQELSALRQTCWDIEDRCRQAVQGSPDTLTHQYLLMKARMLGDQAANLLLWHDLAWFPERKLVLDPYPDFDADEQMDWARQRAIAAGAHGPFKDGDPPAVALRIDISLDQALERFW